ncbi:MAG TPA: HAMP domain-containing histidine kinase [Thermodesulfobacteriaceae bacterium]|nr:HAMP domain-containing histidine kinase [Thermodesulfobacteriaceae bacterium]
MKIECPITPIEFTTVLARIRKKQKDYERYNFSVLQDRTLRAFFDLAQEFETLENFYRITVFVPKEFMKFDCCLYLTGQEDEKLMMVCDSMNGLTICGMSPPENIYINETPYDTGDSFVAPIRSNRRLFARKPLAYASEIIGMFEVFPLSHFGENDRLFFEKYANRIGYNLHYKLIAAQNERHIKFINTLVADIEHNVIVPNMRYKLFLRNLKKRIGTLEEIRKYFNTKIRSQEIPVSDDKDSLQKIETRLGNLIHELAAQYEDVTKHYENTSLFLESLLRRDHFEKGEFVLRRKICSFRKEVIDPQLERYQKRLEDKGIRIDYMNGGIPSDEDIPLAVDVGLLSQVYANLFSNAEKYCQEMLNEYGKPVKFMSYGREIIQDYFGPGKHGIKFNVFTTGPHLPEEEYTHIFDEGYRGKGVGHQPGTGHGLHFIKKIIEVHGGDVGYEPTFLGNNFFFILPIQTSIAESLAEPPQDENDNN